MNKTKLKKKSTVAVKIYVSADINCFFFRQFWKAEDW